MTISKDRNCYIGKEKLHIFTYTEAQNIKTSLKSLSLTTVFENKAKQSRANVAFFIKDVSDSISPDTGYPA